MVAHRSGRNPPTNCPNLNTFTDLLGSGQNPYSPSLKREIKTQIPPKFAKPIAQIIQSNCSISSDSAIAEQPIISAIPKAKMPINFQFIFIDQCIFIINVQLYIEVMYALYEFHKRMDHHQWTKWYYSRYTLLHNIQFDSK